MNITFPVEQARIKSETDKLVGEISALDAKKRALTALLRAIRDGCQHAHAQTGYNERDGAWASPCKYCGHCY